MKQKDIAVIGMIVFMSAIISFIISSKVFTGQKGKLTAETVQPINDNFPPPDTHYFNSTTFDPTELITIGQSDNTDPFNSKPAAQ